MPRLPVYLPGWESGWEPGSSGGDSGGRSHSWEHCVLREGVEPSSQWKVFLYIMYFFTFGGFFLYNFNKDCKQRLRLWWFFFFFLKYWLSWCLGALQVLYRGQRFLFFFLFCTDLSVKFESKILSDVEVMKSSVLQALVFQWCYVFSIILYWTQLSLQMLHGADPG